MQALRKYCDGIRSLRGESLVIAVKAWIDIAGDGDISWAASRETFAASGVDGVLFLALLLMWEQRLHEVAHREELAIWAVTTLKSLEPQPDECVTVVARLVDEQWDHVRGLLLADQQEEELLGKIVRVILGDGRYHPHMAKDVIPRWLERVVRKRNPKILSLLPLFYLPVEEVDSVEALWRAISSSSVVGLDLFCRVAASLGPSRWKLLLRKIEFWKYLYTFFANANSSTPLTVTRRAAYVLREGLEMCKGQEGFELAPWMKWSSSASDSLEAWDGWLTLWEVLDNHSLYLIEPCWASIFEHIALGHQIPKIWLQLVYRKALSHDSPHVVRMVLVFLFQSQDASMWWVDEEFYFGTLLESMTLAVLFRGVSALVYPDLLEVFWRRTMTPKMLARFAQELVPRNPRFRQNFTCVPMMLRVLADSRIPCLEGARELSNAVLFGRSYHLAQEGWRLATNCVRMDQQGKASAWTVQMFLSLIDAHVRELIFELPQEVRAFFASTKALLGALPCEDAKQMACCVFGAASAKEAVSVFERAHSREDTLEWLARLAPGGFDEALRTLGGQDFLSDQVFVESGPFCFALQLSLHNNNERGSDLVSRAWKEHIVIPLGKGEIVPTVAIFKWMRVLLDPFVIRTISGSLDAEYEQLIVSILCRTEFLSLSQQLQELKWQCLALASQNASLSVKSRELLGNHARELLELSGSDLDVECLGWVLNTCNAEFLLHGFSRDDTRIVAFMSEQLQNIVRSCESNWRDAVGVLHEWSRIAFDVSRLMPHFMSLLIELELKHDKFVGVVLHALEAHFAPRWKKGQFYNVPDAEVMCLVAQTGYQSTNDNKTLDQPHSRRLYSRARACIAAAISSLPRGHEVAYLVVANLLERCQALILELETGSRKLKLQAQYAGSPVHRRSVRIWQMACLAITKMAPEPAVPASVIDRMAACLVASLDEYLLPHTSVFVENFIATFLVCAPRCLETVLSGISQYSNMRTSLFKCYAGVAFALLLHRRFYEHSSMSHRLLDALLPAVHSVQHVVRGRVLFLCHKMAIVPGFVDRFDPSHKSVIYTAAKFYGSCVELAGKVERAESDWLERFVAPEPTASSVFVQLPLLLPEIVSELLPIEVFNPWLDFFGVDPISESDVPQKPLVVPQHVEDMKRKGAAMIRNIREEAGESSGFQRKIIPWSLLQLDDTSYQEQTKSSTDKKLPMIVCASLVERAPNLGGLTRTCEVFGVQALTMHDKAVMQTKDYTSLTRTAEQWIETLEVPIPSLVDWLLSMKTQGYALVGLEQSNDSVSIEKFVFPRKCILLLGNESTGLPANLFSLLDMCVEIPQFGMVRSLNVHVSASILICSYALAHHQKKDAV